MLHRHSETNTNHALRRRDPLGHIDVSARSLNRPGFDRKHTVFFCCVPAAATRLSVLASAFLGFSALCLAQTTGPDVRWDDQQGRAYLVSHFVVQYLRPNEAAPPIENLLQVPVSLSAVSTGYIAPSPALAIATKTIAAWSSDEPQPFHASALQTFFQALQRRLSDLGYLGVYVAPDPEQLTEDGQDLRRPGTTDLRIIVALGQVTRIRTLAQGGRVKPSERIDNPVHQRIAEKSPIQPHAETQPTRHDLIRKQELDDYVLMLSRHPGRRVDVALSAAPEIGGVTLDYLVTEVKPWLVYAQLSNTGTRDTSKLREQFGFRHYQLTGNDDVLGVDYSTANFDEAHSVSIDYDARFFDYDRLRWRVYGGWDRYTASDVGFFGEDFTGTTWNLGGEFLANIYQNGPFFLDVGPGLRFDDLRVEQSGFDTGHESLLIPYLVVRASRATDWNVLDSSLSLEYQQPAFTNVDDHELDQLGRPAVDDQWLVLRGYASHSFFLEPLFNLKGWRNAESPRNATLAHELYFSLRGQHAFDQRLIPQYEMVAGGLYTVRGYAESAAAGDDAVIGTAEYRYHLPRALPLEREPRQIGGRPFRLAPQQVFGPTDWDLILRAFLDSGYVISNSGDGIGEDGETLVGTGVGAELQFKRNLTVRVDWGVALKDAAETTAGSQQVHFVLTVLY